MPKKLTNEIVDQRLEGRNIRRAADYTNSRTNMPWDCLICGYFWETTAGHILNNHSGCPMCADKAPLTNERIDQKIAGRPIKRIGECRGAESKIDWECLDCGLIWFTMPHSILIQLCGCPRCAKNMPLTNETIDQRLVGRNIQRLGDYAGFKTKMPWKCLDCDYVWESTPNTVVGSEHGCPQCADNVPLTNEIIDRKLADRTIKRVGDYKGRDVAVSWQCLDCDYDWKAKPTPVLGGSGCPQCGGKLPLTNEIVDQRLIGRRIRRLGDYVNAHTKIPWECMDCENVWDATPTNIVNGERGRPSCQSYGINELTMHDLFKEANIAYESQYCLQNIEKTSRALKFDFYFPELKLAIEYNGKQHYEPTGFWGSHDSDAAFVDQQERDQYKRQFCILHNIQLLEIDGRKYRNDSLKGYVKSSIIPSIILSATG